MQIEMGAVRRRRCHHECPLWHSNARSLSSSRGSQTARVSKDPECESFGEWQLISQNAEQLRNYIKIMIFFNEIFISISNINIFPTIKHVSLNHELNYIKTNKKRESGK